MDEETVNLQALPYTIEGYSQQFVDLPSGTLLFRANNIRSENDGRDFFWDLLGIPTADGFCMTPVHNVFTFPFPYVGFGLNVWGNTFRAAWAKYNCIQVYVLKCSAPVINLISPSHETRGVTKDRKAYASQPIRRCETFGAPCATTPEERRTQLKYLTYDNCIEPAFRERTGCIGNIAIGANDSLDVQDVKVTPANSAMGQYLHLLSKTKPEEAATIAANLYVDKNGHRGIPEIVVHPVKPGLTVPLKAGATTFKDSAKLVANNMKNDIYTLELITCITKDGYESSVAAADSTAANARRLSIEDHLYNFMRKGQTEGFGQAGRIMFDMRTGFYVLTGYIQDGYRLGNRGAALDYVCDFLRPLDTAAHRHDALTYAASVKLPVPKERFLSEMRRPAGYKEAFIFKHPGSLKKVITDLRLNIPTKMADGQPFTALYKYDIVKKQTGGKTLRSSSKSSSSKSSRKLYRKTLRRKQRGAGIMDMFKAAPETAVATANTQYSIQTEQESIPESIMNNIHDFFTVLRRNNNTG